MTPGVTFVDRTPILIPNLEADWRDPSINAAKRAEHYARFYGPVSATHDARVRADHERVWAMIEQENGHG